MDNTWNNNVKDVQDLKNWNTSYYYHIWEREAATDRLKFSKGFLSVKKNKVITH